jgi:hypothetical protein
VDAKGRLTAAANGSGGGGCSLGSPCAADYLGIGGAATLGYQIYLTGTAVGPGFTAGTTGIYSDITIDSSSYADSYGMYYYPSTAAAAVTYTSITGYYFGLNTIGAGSTLTAAYGFYMDGTGTYANNNYAFFSHLPAGSTNWAFYNDGGAKSYSAGIWTFDVTNTAGGTTGAQTINKPSFTVNLAATQTALDVTNSLVTANSIVLCSIMTNDTTAVLKNVAITSGHAIIHTTAAVTAETRVGCVVFNN